MEQSTQITLTVTSDSVHVRTMIQRLVHLDITLKWEGDTTRQVLISSETGRVLAMVKEAPPEGILHTGWIVHIAEYQGELRPRARFSSMPTACEAAKNSVIDDLMKGTFGASVQ